MSHEVPGIPPRRVDPKQLRSKIDALARRKQQEIAEANQEGMAAAARPQDSVEFSAQPSRLESQLEEVNLSYDELEHYVNLLKDEPDPEIDREKVARVKANLEAGRYGSEALKVTVDELLQDLGLK